VQRRSPETSKWRTRVAIARLVSRLSKFGVAGHPSDGAKTKIPKVPLGGVYPSVRFWGNFIFQLHPYNPSGDRMQPSLGTLDLLVLLFSSSIFPLEFLGLA
jgi:hypothetical protein